MALTVPASVVAEIEALLELAGALAISRTDAGDTPLLEPESGAAPLWPIVRIAALFDHAVDRHAVERLVAPLTLGETAWETLADSDWRTALEQSVEPRRIGQRLLLVPAEWDGDAGARTVVRLAMGLAFGTGRHATTALCLEWLDSAPLQDKRLLDLGCGSGVLAIAALKLGAEYAWATDTEPQALAATQRNAARNDVDAALWVGAPSELSTIRADIVIANILAGTLIDSAPLLSCVVRPAGRLVMSGILAPQRHDVERAFGAGFEHFEAIERAGWLRLTAHRKAS